MRLVNKLFAFRYTIFIGRNTEKIDNFGHTGFGF